MHKKILLLILIFFTHPVLAIDTCCVDAALGVCEQLPTNDCSPTATAYEAEFCPAIAACQQGCCCATNYATNPGSWNLDEEGLLKIQASCNQLNQGASPGQEPYAWQPTTTSCVDICAPGTTPLPPTDTYSITGYVDNGTDTLEDATILIAFSTLQDTTDNTGRYEITGAPPLTGNLVATRAGCDPITTSITINGNVERNFTLDCDVLACQTEKPGMTARMLPGTDNAELTFTIGLSCGEPNTYEILRTGPGGVERISVPYAPDASYIDENLAAGDYCYAVAAQHEGQLVPSRLDERTEVCISTGAQECMDRPGREWCDNTGESSMHLTCADDNTLDTTQCGSNEICGSIGNDRYGCITEPNCAECDGLFGMLTNHFRVNFLGAPNDCRDPEIQRLCFEDKSTTTINAHRSCGEITTCEDYLTANQCSANPCEIPAACTWNDLDGRYEEVGIGVCQSSQPAACNSCEEIFGTCSKELCEAIGERGSTSDCYYDEKSNGLTYPEGESNCRHKKDMACRYYDSEADCVGTGTGSVNAQYTNEERTGGDHSVIPGDDKLGIGLCRWQNIPDTTTGGFCYKDADEYVFQTPEDDCIDNGYFAANGGAHGCLKDAEPPSTTLLISTGTTLGIHEVANMDLIVADNYYLPTDIETRFCIQTTRAGDCYPTQTRTEAVAGLPTMSLGDSQSFDIRYYSYDPSGNLEPIQSVTVTLVELGFPRVDWVELRE